MAPGLVVLKIRIFFVDPNSGPRFPSEEAIPLHIAYRGKSELTVCYFTCHITSIANAVTLIKSGAYSSGFGAGRSQGAFAGRGGRCTSFTHPITSDTPILAVTSWTSCLLQ